MRYLLDALFLLVTLLAAPFLLRRKRRAGLWDRFLGRTRLRPFRIPPSAFRILFHGVSVGEIHLLRGIVREFRARHPDWQCVISSTTESGFAEANKWFADLPVVRWPLDFSSACKADQARASISSRQLIRKASSRSAMTEQSAPGSGRSFDEIPPIFFLLWW